MTWRRPIEKTVAEALRICKGLFTIQKWASINTKRTIYKTLIRSVMTRAGTFMQYHHAKYMHNYVILDFQICSKENGYINTCICNKP
jgi:hypothetical protein